MDYIIYTATGCTRCKIVKSFMEANGIRYDEKNMKAEGKDEFQKFYKENRKAIFRGPDGVEFPIITDGAEIRQGIGAAIAYLKSQINLDGFFTVGTLHKEWVDGIHISSGNPEYAEDFIEVLRYLKKQNMKLQIDTSGRNSDILEQVLEERLADVAIMDVLGPENLYSKILGEEVNIEDIKKSISLVPKFPEYKFQTTVMPIIRDDGQEEISYMTPDEVAEAAQLIETATESKKNPYLIKLFKPKEAKNERFKSIEPMSSSELFPYRTKARRYQVLAELRGQA